MLPDYTPKVVAIVAGLLLAAAIWWQLNDPARRAAEAGNKRLIRSVAQQNEAHLLDAQRKARANPNAWEPNFRLASSLLRHRVNQIRLRSNGEEVHRPVGTLPGDTQVQRVVERLLQLAATPVQRQFSEGLLRQLYGGGE